MRPFFLEVASGYRFLVQFPVSGAARSMAVVYVPPFAEEMNKCRHMAAAAARLISAHGLTVLIPDLEGCVDSSGEFGEATWDGWREDIVRAVDWLRDCGQDRIALWGVRLGALLAAEVGRQMAGRIERYLFWQPYISGDLAISQFLRLKIAGDMLSSASATTGLAEARAALAGGRSIEVAGYELTPALANAISVIRLADLVPICPVHWFEVAADPTKGIAQASLKVIEGWRSQGVQVDATVVPGEPFWTSGNNEDVVDCVPLLDATATATQTW